jgi:pilus assembly protein CpaD
MSRVFAKNSKNGASNASNSVKSATGVVSLAILASAMLFLPGCAYLKDRQHITVGSIPDDYRTNHPITLSEQEQHLDVLVGTSDNALSVPQRSVIQGFVDQYKTNGSGPVQIMLPSSGTNAAAARRVQGDIIGAIKRGGVSGGQILTTTYQATGPDNASPIRISYRAMTASTDQCGKWPDDLGESSENKHYADFGCSYQNNLAAMIANPADLIGPRAPGQVDPTKRGKAIKTWQDATASTATSISY